MTKFHLFHLFGLVFAAAVCTMLLIYFLATPYQFARETTALTCDQKKAIAIELIRSIPCK